MAMLMLCCRLFHAHTADGIFLCTQAHLQSRIRDELAAVQTGTSTVVVEHLESGQVREVSSNLQIVGLDVDKEHLIIWDKKKVRERGWEFDLWSPSYILQLTCDCATNLQTEVYGVGSEGLHLAGQFSSSGSSLAIHTDSICCIGNSCVEVCNISGTVKQTIFFDAVCTRSCPS